MINFIRKVLLRVIDSHSDDLWIMAGDIAERFHESESAEFDDLQEKMYYWILSGLKRIITK